VTAPQTLHPPQNVFRQEWSDEDPAPILESHFLGVVPFEFRDLHPTRGDASEGAEDAPCPRTRLRSVETLLSPGFLSAGLYVMYARPIARPFLVSD